MATWRDIAIGTLTLNGVTNIAAMLRRNGRCATPTLTMLGPT
jgi:hypothetical protein